MKAQLKAVTASVLAISFSSSVFSHTLKEMIENSVTQVEVLFADPGTATEIDGTIELIFPYGIADRSDDGKLTNFKTLFSNPNSEIKIKEKTTINSPTSFLIDGAEIAASLSDFKSPNLYIEARSKDFFSSGDLLAPVGFDYEFIPWFHPISLIAKDDHRENGAPTYTVIELRVRAIGKAPEIRNQYFPKNSGREIAEDVFIKSRSKVKPGKMKANFDLFRNQMALLKKVLGPDYIVALTTTLSPLEEREFRALLNQISDDVEGRMKSNLIQLGMRSESDAAMTLKVFQLLGLMGNKDTPSVGELALNQVKGMASLLVNDALLAANQLQIDSIARLFKYQYNRRFRNEKP